MVEWLMALGCSVVGFALIALTQKQHRQRVAAAPPLAGRGLHLQRALAGLLLAASLPIAIRSQGPSFGSITWLLTLTAGAVTVAAILAFRPRMLARLVWPSVPSAGKAPEA